MPLFGKKMPGPLDPLNALLKKRRVLGPRNDAGRSQVVVPEEEAKHWCESTDPEQVEQARDALIRRSDGNVYGSTETHELVADYLREIGRGSAGETLAPSGASMHKRGPAGMISDPHLSDDYVQSTLPRTPLPRNRRGLRGTRPQARGRRTARVGNLRGGRPRCRQEHPRLPLVRRRPVGCLDRQVEAP